VLLNKASLEDLSYSSGTTIGNNPNSGEALPTLATVEDLKGKSDRFEHIVTVHKSRKSVVQLRVFFGDSCAEFKSLELHAAVDNALHTRNDVSAILPTGAGKSLLFFLYAAMHTERTSFVIVPTVSLVCDLMRRAKSHGIRCTNDASKVSNEHLVFVTPEAAVTSVAVREQLMQLYCKKRLGTIFSARNASFDQHFVNFLNWHSCPCLLCF
jgi:hypothetical protein